MVASVTSREVVKKVFYSGKAAWVPFIPWLCIHAAKLQQLPVPKMLTDPALLARALENAQKLYGYDVVINIFDPTLEAEACGCSIRWINEHGLPSVEGHILVEDMTEADILSVRKRGRLPVVLEATHRLKVTLGRTVAVAGVVTGPFTLAAYLKGHNVIDDLDDNPEAAKKAVELAGKVCLEVCKAYCEFELDLVVVAEPLLSRLPQRHLALALSVLGPVRNVAQFYNAVPVLLVSECSKDSLKLLSNIEVEALVVNANLEAGLRGLTNCRAIGRAIPASILCGARGELREYVGTHLKGDRRGLFLSTEGQVPYETPPENIYEIMRLIKTGLK